MIFWIVRTLVDRGLDFRFLDFSKHLLISGVAKLHNKYIKILIAARTLV